MGYYDWFVLGFGFFRMVGWGLVSVIDNFIRVVLKGRRDFY